MKESPIRSDPLRQILLTYAPTRSNGDDPLKASAVAAHSVLIRCQEPSRVEVWVWDDAWLPGFIAQLAADYRGWADERTWQTNHLSVRACFHTGGHVALTWNLHRWLTRSDTWQASSQPGWKPASR